MNKIENLQRRVVGTLWFTPTVLALSGILLGLMFVLLDVYAEPGIREINFLRVQPSAARDMLSVVAGSMITVAGTVFSITIVALTLASTQFSPRILRNFMRDTGNQVVLGAFVGIFAYCIVVLRTIRDANPDQGGTFVPAMAVATGVGLGLSGIGFLIYFIHHVATTIQATSIISQIAAETIEEIEEHYPLEYDAARSQPDVIETLKTYEWRKVPGHKTGYIQNIDLDELVTLAARENCIVRIRRRVGEFAIRDLPLLAVTGADGRPFELSESFTTELNNAYDIGNFRTIDGDLAFGIRQIVDISLKALSAAINDSTTALSCVDYLTSIMVALSRRPSRPPLELADGKVRLLAAPQRFEDFFDLSFNQIRQNAAGNVAVIHRLLTAMELLGKFNRSLRVADECEERRHLIATQAELLIELARRTIHAPSDLATLEMRYAHVKTELER